MEIRKQNIYYDANAMTDKYSIKNLLFYRAIPPYNIPVLANEYKLFHCTDCGDRFIFESSYNHHINRKSVKITYKCRQCPAPQRKVYYNRCNLLSHIRSHSFKTATINVSDLKIEPLPLSFFKKIETTSQQKSQGATQKKTSTITCNECNEEINVSGLAYKHRASHYMNFRLGSEVYSCPICLFTLPTICALKAHLRIHLKIPPFFCPECGCHLQNKIVSYPYNHNCEGFNMMRANARLKCSIPSCGLSHPNDFKQHMKNAHLKKVFKCPLCVAAGFSETTITKHLMTHQNQNLPQLMNLNIIIFYRCELCPGRLVLQSHLDSHLSSHINNHVFPCWDCGTTLDSVINLISHHIDNHVHNEDVKKVYQSFRENIPNKESKKIFRVVKRCDQCLRSFTYKCKYEEIHILPNFCPFKCTAKPKTKVHRPPNCIDTQITCFLCKDKISQKWKDVKAHYAEHHKDQKCVDIKISIPRLNINKYKKKSSISKPRKTRQVKKKLARFSCCTCQNISETKELLEAHIKTHRDPCMAYQCLECGKSFVGKPSFTTHLLLEHGIFNVENYIVEKKCYNDGALTISAVPQQVNEEHDVPLNENQCKICREEFEDLSDLEKHFRVHGMAFLIKNSQNKLVPSS